MYCMYCMYYMPYNTLHNLILSPPLSSSPISSSIILYSPSHCPSGTPSYPPSSYPSLQPSTQPSASPSSNRPSSKPSTQPSITPSRSPTVFPTAVIEYSYSVAVTQSVEGTTAEAFRSDKNAGTAFKSAVLAIIDNSKLQMSDINITSVRDIGDIGDIGDIEGIGGDLETSDGSTPTQTGFSASADDTADNILSAGTTTQLMQLSSYPLQAYSQHARHYAHPVYARSVRASIIRAHIQAVEGIAIEYSITYQPGNQYRSAEEGAVDLTDKLTYSLVTNTTAFTEAMHIKAIQYESSSLVDAVASSDVTTPLAISAPVAQFAIRTPPPSSTPTQGPSTQPTIKPSTQPSSQPSYAPSEIMETMYVSSLARLVDTHTVASTNYLVCSFSCSVIDL